MRVLIVGASGTIGRAVTTELGQRHDVVTAGRNSGDVQLDITDSESIRAAFAAAGPLDAVVSTTGTVRFAPFSELDAAGYEIGLRDKLMGQVNLVLIGRDSISDGGSFTLTTGVLDREPIVAGSSASMVNGAINAFVGAAAIEMPRGSGSTPSARVSYRKRWRPTRLTFAASNRCPLPGRRWHIRRASKVHGRVLCFGWSEELLFRICIWLESLN